jgi:hypothetical protein
MESYFDREQTPCGEEYNSTPNDCDINMDIDDIDIENSDGNPGTPVVMNDFRPSAITLNNLLKRHTTGSKHWTHLVKQPDTYRCCITDMQESGELYRAVWRYVDQGLSVMGPYRFLWFHRAAM